MMNPDSVMSTWPTRVRWARKAERWEAPVVQTQNLIDEIQERLTDGRLPVYLSTETYPCSNFYPDAIMNPTPQFFVLERPDGPRFLVDTQGYTYARYIARLPEGL